MSDEVHTNALNWISNVLGDLDAARSKPGKHGRPRIVAFLAQQATEKAIKAALILEGVNPPRTHDLDELRKLLPDTWRLVRRHPDLARLSDYAAESQYPDDMGPVTPLQSATAVRQAMAVVRSIREDFERRGVPTAALEPR